jgi:CMP-N,N'-diacetyllegionaminic acid synthase
MNKTIYAFIPARSGSTRIRHKNIRTFNGHPLLAYSIASAKQADIFQRVIVSSDSIEYLKIAKEYDAQTHFRKFPCDSLSWDIEWIKQLQEYLEKFYTPADYFMILRPTCPFRTSETIHRAYNYWRYIMQFDDAFDSMKGVTQVRHTPFKTFEVFKYDDYRSELKPILTDSLYPHCYSAPTQLFKHRNFVDQVGFLDICKWDNTTKYNHEFGKRIGHILVDDYEAWDINTELDWNIAEYLLEKGKVCLPKI